MGHRDLAKRVIEEIWQRQEFVAELRVAGSSMGEALPDGSTILVTFKMRPKLCIGSLVYIRKGEIRVAHRLIAVIGPLCLEKGDANLWPRLCLRRDIIGHVQRLTSAN